MNRDIKNVINSIIKEIPIENINLINILKKIIKSSIYIAPEAKNDVILWMKLHHILITYIGVDRPTLGWQKKVIDIYVGDTN
jgi:hypothetical protein